MRIWDKEDKEYTMMHYYWEHLQKGQEWNKLNPYKVLRMKKLLEVGIFPGCSVLDVGCGFGAFYEYLKMRDISVDYTGIDIIPEFIEEAKRRSPECRLEITDLFDNGLEREAHDFVVQSGIFNLKLPSRNNLEFIARGLMLMLELSRIGIASNFLSSRSERKQEDGSYIDPAEIFKLRELTDCFLTVRHDYGEREFTIYAYKEPRQ